MPAKLTVITDDVTNHASAIGEYIRAHRKGLRVSATTAAQSAGMSRVTWHRLEKGEPAVTMGAYLSAMAVLGLEFRAVSSAAKDVSHAGAHDSEDSIPVHVAIADYPQLKQLAWQVHGVAELSPREALGIYERNWRHLDLETMEPHERHLVEALRQVFEDKDHDV